MSQDTRSATHACDFPLNQILTTSPLNQTLTYANHGIYVAICVVCHKQYVGQTKNKFSTRWSSHSSNWNRPNCEIDEYNKDKVALLRHFSEFHSNINRPQMHEAYTVILLKNLIPFL